jgi:hypothetical protein
MSVSDESRKPPREPLVDVETYDETPLRFVVNRDGDGRHRWYLYTASGTIVGSHRPGFTTEREAAQDAERVRAALATTPIVVETAPLDARSI